MDAARPPTRITAAMTTPMRRRLRVDGITSNLDAFGAHPVLHLSLDLLELLPGPRLEPHHQDRLGIRRADQSPSVAVKHAHTINRDDFVFHAEISFRFLHNREFPVVRTIDTNLGRRYE